MTEFEQSQIDDFRRVECATVRLDCGGRAVLVGGNLLLAAAHCVSARLEGQMVLYDCFAESFRTATGERYLGRLLSVELTSDLCVLGAFDRRLCAQPPPIATFLRDTPPVTVSTAAPVPGACFVVYLLTGRGWVRGIACAEPCNRRLGVVTAVALQSGDSGGPILDVSGALVGIVASTSDASPSHGRHPLLPGALPTWAYRQVIDAQTSNQH